MTMITNVRDRANLAAITAQSRMAALAEQPELGSGRTTDEGFHISFGAVAATAVGTAVLAFVAAKMGALH